MTDDRELETWRSEWQSHGGREGLAEMLADRVRRDAWRIRSAILRELVGVPIVVGFCVWLLMRTKGEAIAAVGCASTLVILGISVTRLVTLRQGSLAANANGLDSFIDLTRRRLADDLRWVAFGRRLLQASTVLATLFCTWVLVDRFDRYRAQPWRAIVGFGVSAAVLALLYVLNRRKQRLLTAEHERFETLVAERTMP